MTRARVRTRRHTRAPSRARPRRRARRRATREMSVDVFGAVERGARVARGRRARDDGERDPSTSRGRRRGDVAARAREGKRREGDARDARDASPTPPPRITKRANGMSVATQIELVERFKSLRGGDGGSNANANARRGTRGTSAKPIEGGRRKRRGGSAGSRVRGGAGATKGGEETRGATARRAGTI